MKRDDLLEDEGYDWGSRMMGADMSFRDADAFSDISSRRPISEQVTEC